MRPWETMLERVATERYGRLLAFAVMLDGSLAGGEDLVQDALLATFSARARFASVEQAEAYVRRAIGSRYIDVSRRRARERGVLAIFAPPDSVELDVDLGFAPEVQTALSLLSPRERTCLLLRHVEGLSVRETSKLLRIGEGAVKRYVYDAVAAMNAALDTDSSGEEITVNIRETNRAR